MYEGVKKKIFFFERSPSRDTKIGQMPVSIKTLTQALVLEAPTWKLTAAGTPASRDFLASADTAHVMYTHTCNKTFIHIKYLFKGRKQSLE